MAKAYNTVEFIAEQSRMSEKDILKELLRNIKTTMSTSWQLNDIVDDTISDNRNKKIIAYLEEKIKTASTEK